MEDNSFMDWELDLRNISDFIDECRENLPRIVRVEEGFCGVNEQCSLDTTQILVFLEVVKQNRFIATDVLGRKLSIPANCQHKVQLIPNDCECEYYTIADLKAVCPPYFQVLESIPGTNLNAGALIKICSVQDKDSCFLKCEQVSAEGSSIEQISSQLKGRFLPLLDCGEYHLLEVVSMVSDISSLKICFTNQPDTCTGDSQSIERLDMLGALQIEKLYEEEMIFATTIDNRNILIFPTTLDILITPAKEDSLVKGSPYGKSLQTWTNAKRPDLRRFKLLNQENAFFLEMPLMAFDYKKLIRKPTLKQPRPKVVQRAKPEIETIPEEAPPPVPPKSPKKKHTASPFSSPKKTWLIKSTSADDAGSIITRARKLELLGPPPLPPRKKERSRSDSEMQTVGKSIASNRVSMSNTHVETSSCEELSRDEDKSFKDLEMQDKDADKLTQLPNFSPKLTNLNQRVIPPTPLPRKLFSGGRIKPVPAPRPKPALSENSIKENTSDLPGKIHLNTSLDQHVVTGTKQSEDATKYRSNDFYVTMNDNKIVHTSGYGHKVEHFTKDQPQSQPKRNSSHKKDTLPPPLPPKTKSNRRSEANHCRPFQWNVAVDIPLDIDNSNNNGNAINESSVYTKMDEANELFRLQFGNRPQTIGGSEVSASC